MLASPGSTKTTTEAYFPSERAIEHLPGCVGMDDATMGHPDASPGSTSASFSSSTPASPSSSTFSLPGAATTATSVSVSDSKGKGKFVPGPEPEPESEPERVSTTVLMTKTLVCTEPSANQESTFACATNQSPHGHLPMSSIGSHDSDSESNSNGISNGISNSIKGKGKGKGKSVVSNGSSSSTGSDLYTHSQPTSSYSSSFTSLSSVEEKDNVTHPKPSAAAVSTFISPDGTATGLSSSSGKAAGSSSIHPRLTSASPQYPYANGCSNSSTGSGSGSGSGSRPKPGLSRAVTGPALLERPFVAPAASSSAVPQVPCLSGSATKEQDISEIQDLSLLSYDDLPTDFDFGDLPFYDTDPRTGIIYGDPHAVTRPYLVPEVYFDHYHFDHDKADPRKTNVFNKFGTLLFYHPGRHIGQEQDSLRSQAHHQPMWIMAGRTSTWGNLIATDMASKRQIRIVMDANKKKSTSESNEPLARFVFRWKDEDFVVEYRKQKDQYRITCYQMCGGESKWKPPQPKPVQTMFHGMGMEHPGNVHTPITIGSPSPFDPSRYLQLISEYRLNSGPVHKRGDFELYNPDTFPAEFRSLLILLSIVVLDIMRPIDDKLFYKEFPEVALKGFQVASVGGLHTKGSTFNGTPIQMAVGSNVGSATAPTKSADQDNKSSTSLKTDDVSSGSKDLPPLTSATTPSTLLSMRSKTMPSSTPVKKSRWGSFFRK
ncbi:hypothetical protein BG011_004190 [Mortierella polycephala]|uniref:Uncharacterized protein n=1 Tax=Mortierella polycephala TaxID=41804 RepID=A0A9P6Q168_9FUNG|nr:hypothetical protein BG011_004190 [Mortierella polycephala]